MAYQNTGHRLTQGGNVLFLVLIAVGLFAMISYVVSKTSRYGNNNTSNDNGALVAADMMQYATSVESAVERMQLRDAVQDWQFDFWSPRQPSSANTSCLSPKCIVFSNAGGGVIWRAMKGDTSAPDGSSGNFQSFYSSAVYNVGTTEPDLIMFIGHIPKEACQTINFKMGVSPSLATEPPSDTHAGSTLYSGTLTAFPASTKIWGDTTNTQFRGKRDFCYAHAAWGYVYIHVLMPR